MLRTEPVSRPRTPDNRRIPVTYYVCFAEKKKKTKQRAMIIIKNVRRKVLYFYLYECSPRHRPLDDGITRGNVFFPKRNVLNVFSYCYTHYANESRYAFNYYLLHARLVFSIFCILNFCTVRVVSSVERAINFSFYILIVNTTRRKCLPRQSATFTSL